LPRIVQFSQSNTVTARAHFNFVFEVGPTAMSLIVVSNRICLPRSDELLTGGLAAALLPAVQASGAIWVGSSGRLREGESKALAEIQTLGAGAAAMIDLPAAHYHGFYEGFANSGLWPMLHSRTDLIRCQMTDYVSYRKINAVMARAALRFADAQALFWIHDYHFLTLGKELRELGVKRPVGFFLHTPFPTCAVVASLPRHRDVIRAMLCYDLIGFQTEEDLNNFAYYLRQEFELDARILPGSRWFMSLPAQYAIFMIADR
jgi:trehalose 6-phosphate synthase